MNNSLERSKNHSKRKMTAKMRAFCDEYVSGAQTGRPFVGVAALRAAGYEHTSDASAYAHVSTMLKHPLVKQYINDVLEARSVTTLEVLDRFSDVSRLSVGDILRLDSTGKRLEIDPNKVIQYRRYLKSFGYDSNGNPKIEFHDPMDALKQVARIRGMMKDGLEVSGPNGGAIPVSMQVRFISPDGEQDTSIPELAAPSDDEEPIDEAEWEMIENDE